MMSNFSITHPRNGTRRSSSFTKIRIIFGLFSASMIQIGSAMPEWFAHSSAHPANQLPPMDVKNRMPRKTARSGRSTSKADTRTSSRVSSARSPESPAPTARWCCPTYRASRRRVRGGAAQYRAPSPVVVPLFHLVQNLRVADLVALCLQFLKAAAGAFLRRGREEDLPRLRAAKRTVPMSRPSMTTSVAPARTAAACRANIPARTAAPTRPRHSGSSPAFADSAVTSMPFKIMCCTPSA